MNELFLQQVSGVRGQAHLEAQLQQLLKLGMKASVLLYFSEVTL